MKREIFSFNLLCNILAVLARLDRLLFPHSICSTCNSASKRCCSYQSCLCSVVFIAFSVTANMEEGILPRRYRPLKPLNDDTISPLLHARNKLRETRPPCVRSCFFCERVHGAYPQQVPSTRRVLARFSPLEKLLFRGLHSF